ncbi:type III-B CRISPR module-associated protein Cmr5 [Thermoactinomyces vulgaris]|jgi:CRISPR-associated protein Cmr5|uniref:CRISPR type III-B/RAMP module-associated protein Cmr5 n=1 Tax=Thermoactinomyces vulgaris TaxID=2026 RepID=A0ABS0QEU4_THEVU|nr:type III-B CRISPR module-associated protein Cmr5 [Thermoactinomyces vulgaris]MBA4551284.1 type III-B CRISPR module-associated protein Cmr5 [Thermoactinomyces vulgaris]MBA4595505.1 type III-B CRISPR module-associated protein Cmr5 [Thermoactinomyces vulgaris]MBH8587710.1 type III-B CRISPR module-associated protein Cmr5 [Thermoactinomyces vulgaris]RMB03872.1 CRISPR-associated protein Cmr5 [Thermoactinomyces vulgaris]
MSDRTLEQQRAAYSLSVVSEVKQRDKTGKQGDEYAGYVVNLAGAILINGLGQALAQLRSAAKDKADDPHEWLYQHINKWICKKHPHSEFEEDKDLLLQLSRKSRADYQWALMETLAFLEWHRKIAVAELKKSEPGEEKDEKQ